MHETMITVVGNLVADPEMRTTSRGEVFATFRLACTERKRDQQGQWGDGHTNYVRVTAFRSLGQNVLGTLGRGNRVVVQGRLRVTEWESGERRGTSVEIDAHSVGAELTFAHAKVTKGVWSAVPDPLDDTSMQALREQDAPAPVAPGAYGGPLLPPDQDDTPLTGVDEVDEEIAGAYAYDLGGAEPVDDGDGGDDAEGHEERAGEDRELAQV